MSHFDHLYCRNKVISALWEHYYRQVPFAATIEKAFAARGDLWIEDHVAFRTLPGVHCGMHILQKLFEWLGYERRDDYDFKEKKLKAFWMAPKDNDAPTKDVAPKIFISELQPESFSPAFQECLSEIAAQWQESPLSKLEALATQGTATDKPTRQDQFVASAVALLTQGPSWARPTHRIYNILKEESDYAAWTYLFGHQINHFTVSAHLTDSFSELNEMGTFIESELKIEMNHSGGLVKGTAELLLEQIATMAAQVPVYFQEGVQDISYGFVEFAKRYPLKGKTSDGHWHSYYQGFVAANADKIFESTYK
ncbi:MAG: DUF1338 domain-containing protein [Pseudobacteriovorax sp.]|nr:DUF1338 domain-containing protein [Pseudobacteriovorax sp.]